MITQYLIRTYTGKIMGNILENVVFFPNGSHFHQNGQNFARFEKNGNIFP